VSWNLQKRAHPLQTADHFRLLLRASSPSPRTHSLAYTLSCTPLHSLYSAPVQWSAWMRRTRRDPPTVLELEIDAARQARLQENVARLAIAYQDEKARLSLSEGEIRSSGAGAVESFAEAAEGAEAAERELDARTRKEADIEEVRSPPEVVLEEQQKLGDEILAARSRKQAEEERQAAMKRREEFGKCWCSFSRVSRFI
jgi:hypothetical protein